MILCYFYPLSYHFISVVYLIGELRKLKILVIDAKEQSIIVVPTLVNRMLVKNMFLFGYVEGSKTETVSQLTELQNARVKEANNK